MTNKTDRKQQAEAVKRESTGWMLKMLSVFLDERLQEQLRPLEITKSEFPVLMTLLEKQGLSQAEIGQGISMPGYSVSRNLDSLEKKNLVERRVDENSRRNFRIYLTQNGLGIGPQIFAVIQTVNKNLLEELNSIEKKQFNHILKKLIAAHITLK